MVGYQEQHGEEKLPFVKPDAVALQIDRLQNRLKEKAKEIGTLQAEIKALRATEALKNKAIQELTNEGAKLDKKLRLTEDLLDHRCAKLKLEIKKLTDEKKVALAAKYACEATLRRVSANKKDDNYIPLESIIAPLDAEVKMYKNEIVALQEDYKALERLAKSKEAALLEAERILRSALERVLIVEEVQNKNLDLKRQIEICQEENKILGKTHHQKVLEVEKLSLTIQELEEVILASGATANAVRDYQRRVSELQEEKRTLERELARVKISANRVATVVANEWKDENDKVMPVKQWLEERRIMQAEIQRLKDRLAASERTAKAEAQLKEKLKLRLKTLEESLKHFPSHSNNFNAYSGFLKAEKSNNIFGLQTTNGGLRNRSASEPRGSTISNTFFQQPNIKNNKDIVSLDPEQESTFKKKYVSPENVLKKGIRTSRSKIVDSGEKENELQVNTDMKVNMCKDERKVTEMTDGVDEESKGTTNDDVVSGFLYDRLQKEVNNLRKSCEVKDSSLQSRDEEIKMLMKKTEALTKAVEKEWKKMKREAAARGKEVSSTKSEDNRRNRIINSSIFNVADAC